MKTLFYLASPYSHAAEKVRQARNDAVCEYGALLKREGVHVFSPIAHGHAMQRYGLPLEYDFWRGYCLNMLERCDVLLVLMIDGWKESVGVSDEINEATIRGMPIIYVYENELPPSVVYAEGEGY